MYSKGLGLMPAPELRSRSGAALALSDFAVMAGAVSIPERLSLW